MNDSTFFRGVVDATDSGESGLRFAAAQSYQLTRRRIYILPTRAGWMLAACLLTMLLGAINYNNSLAYALTFLLGSVAMVSILHTYRNQDGLSLRVAPAAPVHVEQLATFNFTIENPRPEPRVGLMVRYLDASGDDVPHPNIVRVGVPANDRVTIALARVATKRGQMQLGRVIVSNRYPFGIFRAWSVWDTSSRVLVYPLLRGEESLPTHAGDGDGEGNSEARGAEDFAGLRSYERGDSPRLVHWKAAARSVELPVKVMTGGGATSLQFDWAALSGDTETRLSQLALWIRKAEQAGHQFSLQLPDTVFDLDSGPAHAERCLTALALYALPPAAEAREARA